MLIDSDDEFIKYISLVFLRGEIFLFLSLLSRFLMLFRTSLKVIFLFLIARKVQRGDYDTGRRGFFTWQKGRYEIIETMGLYWHFVDLVWVFIFAFFYLW